MRDTFTLCVRTLARASMCIADAVYSGGYLQTFFDFT